jgi:hypothetical protein
MVGMIAGDLLGAAVFMVIGGAYFAATDLLPKPYSYFPR